MRTLPDPIPDDYLVTDADLERLGYGHRVTLIRRRQRGDCPPFIKISPHRIGYRMGDVRRWIAARTCKHGGG
jgi:predicted DNA-binding transcriptional regulator AlpA